MSNELFDRSSQVVFGPIGQNGKLVSGLRVKFKVEKTSESAPNKANISIWNLTLDSRTLSEQPGNIITLSAGYGGQLENVFVGDVQRALTSESGSDWVTDFECGDGENAYRDKNVDVSFGPGTGLSQILSTVGGKFGLGAGEQSGIPNKSFQNGFVASGSIRSVLDQLTEGYDLEWSIQDGQLQIIKKKSTLSEESVLLSAATGMISSPKKKDKGLEIKSLLQPKFKPGKAVVVESKFIKGTFRILKVTHEGDTHGQEWYSTLEVE